MYVMVMLGSNTRQVNNKSTVVINAAYSWCQYLYINSQLVVLMMKLIAPKIEETSSKGNVKMAIATEDPASAGFLANSEG